MNQDKHNWKEREEALEETIWESYSNTLELDHEVRMAALVVRQKRLAVKKTAEQLSLDECYVLDVVRRRDNLLKVQKHSLW